MDLDTFRGLIEDFYTSTAIDPPPQGAIDSWHQHLDHLSVSALSGGLNKLKVELERRPYNMMLAIKGAAERYIKENPTMRHDPDYGECEDCNGEGLFYVTYQPNGSDRRQSAVILCGACENWRKQYGSTQGKMRLRKFELEYNGYRLRS